jgi:hypothetical protein
MRQDRFVTLLDSTVTASIVTDSTTTDRHHDLQSVAILQGGLGMSADLTFEAPRKGRFVVSVAEAEPEGPAGYQLRVSLADQTANFSLTLG